jgi:hypothetical protein
MDDVHHSERDREGCQMGPFLNDLDDLVSRFVPARSDHHQTAACEDLVVASSYVPNAHASVGFEQ